MENEPTIPIAEKDVKRELAEKVIREMGQMDVVLGHLHTLSEQLEDETERKNLRRAIAELVADSHEKITLPIARQFPDLHPDQK